MGTTFTRGTVSVGANAYNAACSALAGVAPTWAADAVSVDVTPGRPNSATLNFRQNFGVKTSANFAPSVVDIALGADSTGLVFADGTVKVVGMPSPTGLTSVVELALGWSQACARRTDGTVWCWGTNYYGELGNGPTSLSPTSVPVQATGVAGATRIAAGGNSSCAMAALNDTLMCWGRNSTNAFMDGTGMSRLTPSVVRGLKASKVTLGADNMCFIDPVTLVAMCGGDNSTGQLGAGDTVSHPSGATAGTLSTQSIAVGALHACAAGPDGHVRCWGGNFSGQLGLNNQTNSSVPVVLGTPTGVEEVVASDYSTCARTVAGVVYCWGNNYYGEVGDGTNSQRLSPVQVLTGSKKLRAGNSHFCSLQADASVKCWGSNSSGQLLDGTTATSDLPVSAKL